MNRTLWVLLVLVLAVCTWFSITYWMPELSRFVLKNTGNCPSGDFETCKDVLSALGATGDIFGAVTSLFSGLALFAVAFTLWADAKAKREGRKPLVVTYFDGDSVILGDPSREPAGLTMKVSSKVSNSTAEAALNVAVECEISAGQVNEAIDTIHLQLPLLSGGAEEVDVSLRLTGGMLQSALTALTEDHGCVALSVTTRYHSVEGVVWTTSVIYELRCRSGERRKRLNSLRSGTDDFHDLWKNSAAVPLDVDVRSGSWRHAKA